jgi:lipopolysaccharide assembly protein A
MSKIIGILLFFLVLVLGVSFSSLNSAPVEVNYYIGKIQLPLSVVVVCSFALGVLCALLITAQRALAQRLRLASLRREVARKNAELDHVRNLPDKSAA